MAIVKLFLIAVNILLMVAVIYLLALNVSINRDILLHLTQIEINTKSTAESTNDILQGYKIILDE